MNNETLLMTNLEEQLQQDNSGQYRQELLTKLNSKLYEVQQILNKGCKPSEYQKMVAMKEAIVSAETIIAAAS